MANGHGGKRAGSGSKPGWKLPRTLQKEAMRNRIVERVGAELDPILDAAIAAAKGIKYLVARDEETGRFERVKAADVVGSVALEVWEKDPSIQALTDLLNRTVDKPREQPQDVNLNVTGDLAVAIAEGRQRAAARNRKP